ncbi:hypothetical protein BH11PSE2_BH11PSE2_04310 [soil metagenome]
MTQRAAPALKYLTRLSSVLSAALLLGACASPPDLVTKSRIEPNSALAMAISRVQATPLAYPKFSDIPAVPTDVRSPEAWKSSSSALQTTSGALKKADSDAKPEIADVDAFAKQLRNSAGLPGIEAPSATSAAETEAFARSLRERATPPPPPN